MCALRFDSRNCVSEWMGCALLRMMMTMMTLYVSTAQLVAIKWPRPAEGGRHLSVCVCMFLPLVKRRSSTSHVHSVSITRITPTVGAMMTVVMMMTKTRLFITSSAESKDRGETLSVYSRLFSFFLSLSYSIALFSRGLLFVMLASLLLLGFYAGVHPSL